MCADLDEMNNVMDSEPCDPACNDGNLVGRFFVPQFLLEVLAAVAANDVGGVVLDEVVAVTLDECAVTADASQSGSVLCYQCDAGGDVFVAYECDAYRTNPLNQLPNDPFHSFLIK